MGLTLADIEPPPAEIWACNHQAFRCFDANATQWRLGQMGPVALDYNPCYQWCSDMGITGAERAALMADLRYLEAGALEGMKDAQENDGKSEHSN